MFAFGATLLKHKTQLFVICEALSLQYHSKFYFLTNYVAIRREKFAD